MFQVATLSGLGVEDALAAVLPLLCGAESGGRPSGCAAGPRNSRSRSSMGERNGVAGVRVSTMWREHQVPLSSKGGLLTVSSATTRLLVQGYLVAL